LTHRPASTPAAASRSASSTRSRARSSQRRVVATLVGSIGLVAAVPLTTGIAALLGTRMPASALLPASDRVTVR
jgi:hypothetical protein